MINLKNKMLTSHFQQNVSVALIAQNSIWLRK